MTQAAGRTRLKGVRRKAIVFILQVPGAAGAIWACFAMIDQLVQHISEHEIMLFQNHIYSAVALLVAFGTGILGLLDYLKRIS